MINIEKAKTRFLEETSQYDLSNPAIERKQSHSLRVMENAKEIATKMNMKEEQIEIATIIGLLHDIARFEQYTKYQTYSDQDSFDHGDRGVEILQENAKIREFVADSHADNLILTAIRNHNKYAIEDGLETEELKFAKIIRDADKLDIFYEACEIFWKDEVQEINESKISDEVLEQVEKEQTVLRKKGRRFNQIDSVIELMALAFDLNEKASFEILVEQQYIERIFQKFELKDKQEQVKFEQVKNKIQEFVQRKMLLR